MKILIVEDDPFFQHFYARKLKESGYEVETANNGEEGLKMIDEAKPDLILLDIIMPKKDGFEVLQTLSQNQLTKKIPVLVFSTLGEKADVEKAMKLGAVDYVNKSFFDFDNLNSKISAHIKK